jgi:hypothetical protein
LFWIRGWIEVHSLILTTTVYTVYSSGYMDDRLADWEDIVVDQRLDRGSASDLTSEAHRLTHNRFLLSLSLYRYSLRNKLAR